MNDVDYWVKRLNDRILSLENNLFKLTLVVKRMVIDNEMARRNRTKIKTEKGK